MGDGFPDFEGRTAGEGGQRRVRADAQRNLDALLQAAKAVFTTQGVDAPVREIAEKAGVGVGTLYRHFPQRADLIAAVFRREIDACADAAPVLAAEYPTFCCAGAVDRTLCRFRRHQARTGRGAPCRRSRLSGAAAHRNARLLPALDGLLESAAAAGEIRPGVDAEELLTAIANLCAPAHGNASLAQTQRMVALLVDGLRYRPKA